MIVHKKFTRNNIVAFCCTSVLDCGQHSLSKMLDARLLHTFLLTEKKRREQERKYMGIREELN
jgi:hypothetical protein